MFRSRFRLANELVAAAPILREPSFRSGVRHHSHDHSKMAHQTAPKNAAAPHLTVEN